MPTPNHDELITHHMTAVGIGYDKFSLKIVCSLRKNSVNVVPNAPGDVDVDIDNTITVTREPSCTDDCPDILSLAQQLLQAR